MEFRGLGASVFRVLARLVSVGLIATGLTHVAVSPAVATGDLGFDSELDYAVDFNGASLAENTGQVVPATGDLTIEAWIRPTSFKNWSHIIDQGQAGVTGIAYLKLDGAGQFVTYLEGSGNTEVVCGRTTLNAWNHVAVTLSGTTLKCYLDGVERNTQAISTGTLGAGFRVSSYRNQADYYHQFAGEIDQVKVWSGALTQPELASSMHALGATDFSGSSVAGAATLLAHYDFNEGFGSTIYDRVGDKDLTLARSPWTFSDIKKTTHSGSATFIAFPRTYLPGKKGWVPPSGVTKVKALIVAGGGGGGAWVGGGGGAGGFFE